MTVVDVVIRSNASPSQVKTLIDSISWASPLRQLHTMICTPWMSLLFLGIPVSLAAAINNSAESAITDVPDLSSPANLSSIVNQGLFVGLTTNTPRLAYQIPDDFKVTITFKPKGNLIPRLNFYTACTDVMARMAKLPWEQSVLRMTMDPVERIVLRFVSGVKEPYFQPKSIMWTILSSFLSMNMQLHWADMTVQASLDTGTIGVGDVAYRPRGALSANGSLLDASGVTEDAPFATAIDGTLSTNASQHVRLTAANKSPDDNAQGLQIKLGFVEDGRKFEIETVYASVMYLMLAVGPFDTDGAMEILGRWDQVSDCTLALLPWSERVAEDFKWWMVVDVLRRLPEIMARPASEHRFIEVTGQIRYDGRNIGRLLFLNGKHTPENPGFMERVYQLTGGDVDDGGNQTGVVSVSNGHSEPPGSGDGTLSVLRPVTATVGTS